MKYKGMTMPEVMVAMILTGILCISVMNAASIMGKLGAMFQDGTEIGRASCRERV